MPPARLCPYRAAAPPPGPARSAPGPPRLGPQTAPGGGANGSERRLAWLLAPCSVLVATSLLFGARAARTRAWAASTASDNAAAGCSG